ncbi:MAG: hypothetical protein ACUVV0_01800 [Anaerolineae bacterium]
MSLQKISVSQEAARLTEPFSMMELAGVDYFAVDIYICQGAVAWHKHIDQDELFMVHSGVITLESEFGNVVLQPYELAVVPKGLGHRSSSFLWSVVFLFQPKFMADRRNGDRRLFILKGEERLEKISVMESALDLTLPFSTVDLACIEDFVLRLSVWQGAFHRHAHLDGDEMILVQEGEAFLESELGGFSLRAGEMVVVPKGVAHRPMASEQAVVLLFSRQSLTVGGD